METYLTASKSNEYFLLFLFISENVTPEMLFKILSCFNSLRFHSILIFLEEYFDQWVHQAWMMLRRCLNLELSAVYSVRQYSWSNSLVGTSGCQWVQLLLKAGSALKLNYVAPGHIQSSFFFFFFLFARIAIVQPHWAAWV